MTQRLSVSGPLREPGRLKYFLVFSVLTSPKYTLLAYQLPFTLSHTWQLVLRFSVLFSCGHPLPTCKPSFSWLSDTVCWVLWGAWLWTWSWKMCAPRWNPNPLKTHEWEENTHNLELWGHILDAFLCQFTENVMHLSTRTCGWYSSPAEWWRRQRQVSVGALRRWKFPASWCIDFL